MLVLEKSKSGDYGNGFGKIVKSVVEETKKGKSEIVNIEPSIMVYINEDDVIDPKFDIIRINGGQPFILGKDALESGLSHSEATGGSKRYQSEAYKELIFGNLIKEFRQDVQIPLHVLGLPVNYYANLKGDVEKFASTIVEAELNEQKFTIEVIETHILPQNLGTYFYLLKRNLIQEDSKILLLDCGFGDFGVTSMSGSTIVETSGDEIGFHLVADKLRNYVLQEYRKKVELHEIPLLLKDGFFYDGTKVNLVEDEHVQKILEWHFEQKLMKFAKRRYTFENFDYIVFTGGTMLTHRGRIISLPNKNKIIVEDGQIANVLGFDEYGSVVMNVRNSPV